MIPKVEVLLLLIAWAAIFGLFIAVPWGVVRVVVGLLEADIGTVPADHLSTAHEPSEMQGATTRSEDERHTLGEPMTAKGGRRP